MRRCQKRSKNIAKNVTKRRKRDKNKKNNVKEVFYICDFTCVMQYSESTVGRVNITD